MDFEIDDGVAIATLDDGKANAVGHALIDGLNEVLDRSEQDDLAVVIVGREGLFSAGFDLKEFEKGPDAAGALVDKGARLFLRLFSHPQAVVAACTGHAIAAGAFLLLAADTRLGVPGDFKIGLNETAIGMTLPVFALELASSRLSRRHLQPAVVQARLFAPEEAVDAGFLDQLSTPAALRGDAIAEARRLGEYQTSAYGGNKRLIRAAALERIRASLDA